MAHYTIKNLSTSGRRFSLQVFKVLAGVCEALVFVYIGTIPCMHTLAYCAVCLTRSLPPLSFSAIALQARHAPFSL